MPLDYDAIAIDALRELVASESAVVWLEVEAKLAGPPMILPGGSMLKDGLNPHHLTTARQALHALNEVKTLSTLTRGGTSVPVLVPVNQRGRKRQIADAAARKRLLHARYSGWAKATASRGSLIGDAGERVAHASLVKAAPSTGYRVDPRVGAVDSVFGMPLDGGPADAAAHLLTMRDAVPGPVVTLLVEVKNIREWIYPDSTEFFQLLDKASRLQLQHPDQALLPVLACRRAQYTAFRMAKTLGCYIADARKQFILPHAEVDDRLLAEVRAELGFVDLERSVEPDSLLTHHFERGIPAAALEFASRFKTVAETVSRFANVLRDRRLSNLERAEAMTEFRETLGASEGW